MMRRFLLTLAMTLPVAAMAQTGVVAVHPENNSGKLLTMEEAVMGIGTRPAAVRAFWLDNDTYAIMEGRELKAFKASTGEAVEYKPESRGAARGMTVARGSVLSSKGVAAYTKGQSLYINDGNEVCVAESENNQITYGQSVSRNEFGINGGIFWSPSGEKLAFYRKDESRVTDFPLLDINTRTGTLMSIKYPMVRRERFRLRQVSLRHQLVT